MRRLAPIALAGVGGSLLLILAGELTAAASRFDAPESEFAALPAPTAQSPGAAEASLPSAAAILGRPLFNWNRRPGPVAGAADGGPAPRLSGIIMSGSQSYAIFAAPPGGQPRALPEGSAIGRFKIDKIASDHVVLTGGSDQQTLHVTFSVAPPPPMATPDAS